MMNAHAAHRLALILSGIALAFASSQITAQQTTDDPHEAVADFLQDCGPRFEQTDARVAEAGAGDASYLRVAGFPYLRTDRLLSSYDHELDDTEALEAWLLQLRDNDNFSREIELRNLGLDTQERSTLLLDLRLCAVWLSFFESSAPERRRALIRAVRTTAEAAAAPAASAAATKPVREHQARQVWQTDKDAEAQALLARFTQLPRDALQRTGLTVDGWKALAAEFAPSWTIASTTNESAPAALAWDGERLIADTSTPTVYFMPGFARASDAVLMQFHYFVWFADDDGAINGVIWRVTLDREGRPLLYDSIGADGSRYRAYPARALDRRRARTAGADLIDTEVVGVGPIRVAIDASTAAVASVGPDIEIDAPQQRRYTLVAYEGLLMLPRNATGTLSAFDATGRLRQADNPPPMQLGSHHPLAPQLRFDDPRLLETLFVLPTDIAPAHVASTSVR